MNTDVLPARPVSAKAAWVCLVIAWFCFLIPLPGIGVFVGWPLNLVAFILAIVVMAKGSTQRGLWPLLASIIASPIIYFIGLAVLAGTAAGISEAGKADSTASAMREEATAIPEMTVTAAELFNAYDQNEVAADGRYKGKRLLVTGAVEAIDSGMGDEPTVRLQAASPFQSVMANGLSKADAGALAKGQTISLACVGGGEIIGSPLLSDCEVVP